MKADLHQTLLERLHELDVALTVFAAEVPDNYPLLLRINYRFTNLRQEVNNAIFTLREDVVTKAFERAASGKYIGIGGKT